jgi:hypothetical protein
LDLVSTPTQAPTYLALTTETDLPTYLSLTTEFPTYLRSASSLCPDALSKSESLFDDLTLSYEVISVDERQVFCSELVYEGEGWLGLGTSKENNGEMIGSTAVIGVPDYEETINPGLYSLDGKTNLLVKLLPEEEQTLLSSGIVQSDGVTVLRFAIYMDDENFTFQDDVTTFIFAAADSNEFAYHGMRRGSVSIDLSNGKKKEGPHSSRVRVSGEKKKKKTKTPMALEYGSKKEDKIGSMKQSVSVEPSNESNTKKTKKTKNK